MRVLQYQEVLNISRVEWVSVNLLLHSKGWWKHYDIVVCMYILLSLDYDFHITHHALRLHGEILRKYWPGYRINPNIAEWLKIKNLI